MTTHTITRMYDDYGSATAVVNSLEASGIPHSDISLVANADAHGRYTGSSTGTTTVDHGDTKSGAGTGALLGGVVGGSAGLLAGIGSLAIPGIGPLVAAGWLVATLAGVGVGAATGGLLGALTGAGVDEQEAHVYTEGVRRGGSLVTVRVAETDLARVNEIMNREGAAVDWQQRRASYGPDWRGFDPAATVHDPALPTDRVTRRH